MKRANVIAAVAIIAVLALIMNVQHNDQVLAQPPIDFAKYYGMVTVEGVTPPLGTIIRAKIGNKVCGQSEIHEIPDFGVGYNVDVLAASREPRCAGNGDTVKFEWLDPSTSTVLPCLPTAIWNPIGFHRHDLTCSSSFPQEPEPKVTLYAGWNFVEWLPSECKSGNDAFSGLAPLDVAWKFFASNQGWQSYDPEAAPSLNTLGVVCPRDILMVHVASAVVWDQGP